MTEYRYNVHFSVTFAPEKVNLNQLQAVINTQGARESLRRAVDSCVLLSTQEVPNPECTRVENVTVEEA